MDEVWDDTDTVTFDGVPFTTMTTYTAMDLEPETSVAVRVGGAGGWGSRAGGLWRTLDVVPFRGAVAPRVPA